MVRPGEDIVCSVRRLGHEPVARMSDRDRMPGER